MGSQLGNWQATQWLNDWVNNGAWVSLHDDDPTAVGDPSTEIIGQGYGRQFATFTAAGSKSVALASPVRFVSLPQCLVTYFAFWTDQSSGHLRATMQLTTPISVSLLGQIPVGINDLSITLP